jgi:hypothetical protein
MPQLTRSWLEQRSSALERTVWLLLIGLLTLPASSQPANAVSAGTAPAPLAVWRTESSSWGVDAKGSLSELLRLDNGRNYLATGQPAPLLSLRIDGKFHGPDRADWNTGKKQLTLDYPAIGATATLAVQAKSTHVVFELAGLKSEARVELVLWGPYPTTVGEIVGGTVGVARDGEFAVGIQALNAKTLGGYPSQENDVQGGYTVDDHGHYPDLPPELNKDQGYRGDTARVTSFGSVLQAYCRNRDQDRILANWGHEKYLVPAYNDGGVIGSKIALFACPASKALETIGAVEVAEGLPHPILDGVWGKLSPTATASYLIVDFSESTIDRAIEMAKRAGLKYLYHSSPFETWGHFKLKPGLFPHGRDGLRACVEKARRAGVRLGFHTLSNFITPNDPFVTPKPDPRLAWIGSSPAAADVDAAQKEIPVTTPDFFRKATFMNTVRIDDELIRYGSMTGEAPWRLLGCQRGAWGTRAVPHAQGAVVAKLMDHSYKVFLPNASLSQEVARNIAQVRNETGCLQLSFDGLEGNWSTGMGKYGRTLFTQAWYDALAPGVRGEVINDASNPGHFNWHINTRMNWGEPWYAGFRESQTLYRFKNQVYFERNLMPPMLGWFALRPDTSLEDAEWLLARAAGFGAGFALASSLASTAQLAADPHSADAAKQFGAMPAILEAVNQWETARMERAFPSNLRVALRDSEREFHLEPAEPGKWRLHEIHLERVSQATGNEEAAACSFRNPYDGQELQWIVRCAGGKAVKDVTITVNGKLAMALGDRSVPAGGNLKYRGGSEAVIYDAAWKEIVRVPVDEQAARVGSGEQHVLIGCPPQPGNTLKIELRTLGPGTLIEAKSSQ